MAIKELPTLGVLGVYTGRTLGDGKGGNGFAEIHEVMDHFYPGIMTLGCAAMAETASREVLRQLPDVASLPAPEDWSTGYASYAASALERFGPTMALDGPHGTGNPDMEGK